MSVLDRCPYKRRHYDDVTYDSTYSFKWSVAKTGLTLVFKMHLNLLIHSTDTVFVAYNIVHLSYKVSTVVDKSPF